MPDPDPAPASDDHPDASPERQALKDAVAGIVASVARLAVARGLPCATVEEMLRLAFVQAADQAHPGLLPHRKVSRISTATGINRREVTRLMQPQPERVRAGSTPAAEVFTHWRSQPPYSGSAGVPLALPRQGPAPSFESLAQAVTRDVHPRSLLDELCRLGLATWDRGSDEVTLSREAFVPQGDRVRMLGFLADNVGDHLRAALDNVLGDNRTHFEQAVFADGLSEASIAAVRPAVRAQWQALLASLVPVLEAAVEADGRADPPPRGRLRVGLYTYHEAGPAPAPAARPGAGGRPAAPSAPTAAPRRAKRKETDA